MIFARDISDNLTSLVKKIDAATVANKSANMGSFVVFLNDDEDFPKRAADLAKKEEIKKTVLAKDNPAGPGGYDIPKEADITVILYTKRNVKVNYVFKKGELKTADIDKIIKDLPMILPAK
jgi:hypothetical protein